MKIYLLGVNIVIDRGIGFIQLLIPADSARIETWKDSDDLGIFDEMTEFTYKDIYSNITDVNGVPYGTYEETLEALGLLIMGVEPPIIVPDAERFSLEFDGVSDYSQASDKPEYDFDGTTAFTISVWFRTNNFGILSPIVSKKIVGGAGYLITNYLGDLYFWMHDALGGKIECSISAGLIADTWYHLVVSYDGSQTAAGVEMWIDKVLQTKAVQQDTLTDTIASGVPLAIGLNGFGGALYWLGFLYYIRMWDMKFIQENVDADYFMREAPTEEANLVFGWKAGTGALYTESAYFAIVEESGLNDNPAPRTYNMGFSNKSSNIPPTI